MDINPLLLFLILLAIGLLSAVDVYLDLKILSIIGTG